VKITILSSDDQHPINIHLNRLMNEFKGLHDIELVRNSNELEAGQILFLVSCVEKIPKLKLDLFDKTFVLHASKLPLGRGWSPIIWQILEGKTHVTLSMIEASEVVDKGDIWETIEMKIPKTALYKEINEILFKAEMELIRYVIKQYPNLSKKPQSKLIKPTYYPRRSPKDSELNINKTISEQFNLMRTCDDTRYPAFFLLGGSKYKLTLEKVDE
jgi:methionyl-tRNA formyltransferase